jgi:hypothetical protein
MHNMCTSLSVWLTVNTKLINLGWIKLQEKTEKSDSNWLNTYHILVPRWLVRCNLKHKKDILDTHCLIFVFTTFLKTHTRTFKTMQQLSGLKSFWVDHFRGWNKVSQKCTVNHLFDFARGHYPSLIRYNYNLFIRK